jgi:FkbM family methyltransferase
MHLVGRDRYPYSDRELPLGYESDITDQFVRAFLRDGGGDVFVDVGAHLGTWTLRLAPLFKHVIAFEPCPAAYDALVEHLLLNSVRNVTVIAKAVSRKAGTAKLILYDCPGHSALEGCPIERSEKTGEVLVETIALDSLSLPGRLDMLKVDTEAHEGEVLAGAAELLKTHAPRLCIENHNDELRASCKQFLEQLGLSEGLRFYPEYGGWTLRL